MYWVMFYAMLLLLSGIVMWFPEFVPFSLRALRPIAVMLHEIAALIAAGAFIIHVYMGVFMVPGSSRRPWRCCGFTRVSRFQKGV